MSIEVPPDTVARALAYHERTKHGLPDRYAAALGYLDWETQPDPFRRFAGAPLVPFVEVPPTEAPTLDAVYVPARQPTRPVDAGSIAQLLYDSLALSAWKQHGAARWSLRCDPSSGNLHPTEGYLVLSVTDGIGDAPALYHYAPYEHALERRRVLATEDAEALFRGFPRGAFFFGFTSIHWREAWKYGERAYRYCQHDMGHVIAAVAYAASALGWEVRICDAHGDDALAALLGVEGQRGPEAERADCLLCVFPHDRAMEAPVGTLGMAPDLVERVRRAALLGTENALSADHQDWAVIDEVADACRMPVPPAGTYSVPGHALLAEPAPRSVPARGMFRQRRSAVALDGHTAIDAATFYRMMLRVMPGRVPFSALPWRPAIHPLLFVHRVEGVDAGLYVLVRDASCRETLARALDRSFEWTRPPGCPEGLPLFLLHRGDTRRAAKIVSCFQDIAADGAFAVAMLAEFEPRLRAEGAWMYRRLHWEAGALGQVLYLEAEAAGVRGTGIGCFFDDGVHEVAGIDPRDRTFHTLYNFTLGGPVDDSRLQTLPAYFHLRR